MKIICYFDSFKNLMKITGTRYGHPIKRIRKTKYCSFTQIQRNGASFNEFGDI